MSFATAEIIPYHSPTVLDSLLDSSERALEYSIQVRERAVQLAESSDDVALLVEARDQAETIRKYYASRNAALEAQNNIAEGKIRLEQKIGRVLKENEGFGKGKKSLTMRDFGIDHNQSSRWQKIARIPEPEFSAHIEATKTAGKELTTASVLKLAAQLVEPIPAPAWDADCGGQVFGTLTDIVAAGLRFRTIYADPPWKYGNQATRASTDNHYPTMTVDEICAEPVQQVAEDDAHLHLWTTNAFLRDAFGVMEAWGFTYKSMLIWCKPQMGIGNYWRVSHEILLFGLRGNQPFLARDEMSWVRADRSQHSAKPDVFRSKVERVSPGPYLEMYGRAEVPNSAWTVYGNQVGRRLF